MDPHAVLELDPTASPEEVTAAYRRMAKRFHPDRAGEDAQVRMAQINVAYELLRSGLWQEQRAAMARRSSHAANPSPASWLSEPVRRALGPELLRVLDHGEPVRLVTPAATWASPSTLLAVTDRRLLWLLDDVPLNRVRFVRFRDLEQIRHRLVWPRRRVAEVKARTRTGRRISFAELRPATAEAIVRAATAQA